MNGSFLLIFHFPSVLGNFGGWSFETEFVFPSNYCSASNFSEVASRLPWVWQQGLCICRDPASISQAKSDEQ